MGLKDDLEAEVRKIFASGWSVTDTTTVPEPEDVKLGNDAKKLKGTVLYADMAGSTTLVDTHTAKFAAEVYKAYLHCAAKIIRSEDGVITAYDGDRIMAVYVGGTPNSSAARSALKINYARTNIINPALKRQYPSTDYELKHTVGVDTSELLVARTGIRGSNDLVWVGRAANHAAKLCELGPEFPSWITADVYNAMIDDVKTTKGQAMWEARTWNTTGRAVYRSNWTWPVS